MSSSPSTPHGDPTQALLPDLKFNDDLFDYTRGRFVQNEKSEMASRHVKFNVNELARIAAQAAGSKICVEIKKFPDGMYNKAMLLTMDDGVQVIAKIPNPNAGRKHFTTASEVATMDFMRNVLKTPVPKVLAYSSRADENPVGAEYIILEKVDGIELEQVWEKMEVGDRLTVVKTIASYQKAWVSASFKGFGALYYTEDLDAKTVDGPLYTDVDGAEVENSRFTIGLTTGREWFDDGRGTVNIDRGPWKTIGEYHTAVGHREIAAISQLTRLPKSPITLCGPGTYQPTRERKLKALDHYLKLVPYLLPSDPSISSSHLWHGDLHVANIFVNPLKHTEIVGIIDWQSTELAPLYHHSRQPQIIDYDGPQMVGLERPHIQEDIMELDTESKLQAKNLYLLQSLCSLYNTMTHIHNPRIFAAFEFQQTTSHLLLLLARNLLIDGEATYLSQVAALESEWDTLPGIKGSTYPFSFSTQERQEIEANVEGVVRGMEAMRAIRNALGNLFPEQGLVRPELYQESLDALEQMREQVIEEFARNEEDKEVWRKEWPFGI